MITMVRRSFLAAFAALFIAAPAFAADTQVAVAANFTEPAKEIAAAFKKATGNEAGLEFGSSGAFYTQIAQGAPFEVFLSADADRPEQGRAGRPGRAGHAASPMPSAGWCSIRRRRAWSTTRGAVLTSGKFNKLVIADPAAAPYGVAAIQTMKKLGVYDALKPKIVKGSLDHPGLSVRRRPARPSSASSRCRR